MLDITAKSVVCSRCLKYLAFSILEDKILIHHCGSCKLEAVEEAFDRGFDDGFVTGRAKKGT